MFGQEMSNKTYREHEGVSRSELNIILTKSPMHFKYSPEHQEEEVPALLEGRAAHKLILEPETFTEEFAIAPKCDRRTIEGKTRYAEFVLEAEDLLARCICHENDHLDGILFIDKSVDGKVYHVENDDDEEE